MAKPTTHANSVPPPPPAVDVEAQKCASMSRQHRLLALSASDDVAGTWKDISAASTSATDFYIPNDLPTTAIGQKKARTTPASPDRASALPGDIGNDRASIYARSRQRRCPGSPLGLPGKFQASRGTGSAKTREGARTTTVVLALPDPQSQWGDVEQIEGVIPPPLRFFICQKMAKPRRRRQAALRRFLTTLLVIGCNFAPDLNHAYPQGVPLDSLGSFSSIGGGELGDTLALRAFFERAVSAIILYVLYHLYIHNIFHYLQ